MANTLLMSGETSKLISNLLAGRMVDFEIRCPGYVFKVHRIVLASASSYFEAVCAGGFKESEDGYLSSDIDPVYIAALIIGVYARGRTIDLGSSQSVLDLGQRLLDSACCELIERKSIHDLGEVHPVIVYARLYKVADYYQFDTYRHAMADKFKELLWSSEVTIENIIDIIEVLYDYKIGYTVDDTLRAVAVYIVQKLHHKVTQVSRFDELIRCYPEFALDYATKYNRANWIYCPECKINVTLEECQCGFSSVCGYKFCTTQDFGKMRCTICDRKGHMMKKAPITDRDSEEEVEGLKIAEILDEERSYKTPPVSPSKKRKMKLASGA